MGSYGGIGLTKMIFRQKFIQHEAIDKELVVMFVRTRFRAHVEWWFFGADEIARTIF